MCGLKKKRFVIIRDKPIVSAINNSFSQEVGGSQWLLQWSKYGHTCQSC